MPSRLLDALRVETADLLAAGWSHAPASFEVAYGLLPESVRPFARPATPRPPSWEPTTARLALEGRPLPRFEDALRVGECVKAALMGCARRILGEDRVSPCLSGHELPEGVVHGHAFYLSECDAEGRISHVLIHAPMHFDGDAIEVIGALREVAGFSGQLWGAMLEDMVALEDAAVDPERVSPLCGESRHWISTTPYLHPWHRKPGFGPEEQLRRECEARGLPRLLGAEPAPDPELRPGRPTRSVRFHRFRRPSRRGQRRRRLEQPDRMGGFWQLDFETSVQGPLALGFACHYGLGSFRPV